MTYSNFTDQSPDKANRFIPKFEAISPRHYEENGVHFIINRYEGDHTEEMTDKRYIQLTFGSVTEKSMIERNGEEVHGLRHFCEHVVVRLFQKLYVGDADKNILDCFDELHDADVSCNGGTYSNSLYFIVETPHDEDFTRPLEAMNRVLHGELTKDLIDVAKAMEQEEPRIINEILSLAVQYELHSFGASHIYTKESGLCSPNNLGTVKNLQNADPVTIASIINAFTEHAPVIVTIHNPPNSISDKQIIDNILAELPEHRPTYRAEVDKEKNILQHPHTWIHLGHEFTAPTDKIEAGFSIPIEDLTDTDIAAWEIFAAICISGSTSEFFKNLHYVKSTKLYGSKVRLYKSSSDIQIDASIDIEKLEQFVVDVHEFFSSDRLEQLITEYLPKKGMSRFEVFKQRIMNKLIRTYQDTDLLTELIRKFGRFVSPSENIIRMSKITVQDMAIFLEKLQKGLHQASLVTQSGVGNRKIETYINDHRTSIGTLIPLIKIVQSDGQKDDIVHFN